MELLLFLGDSPARYGALSEKDGLVESFEEKTESSMSGLINGGFMILIKRLLRVSGVIHVHLKTISFQLLRVTSSFLHLSTMAFGKRWILFVTFTRSVNSGKVVKNPGDSSERIFKVRMIKKLLMS